ncbi:MAG: TldD/PmbA family protein [Candidatus Lokiarchaeota archaeon]|nr:TldD/PmbA family protein [Candidatus Lokiarchaeota archaeon]
MNFDKEMLLEKGRFVLKTAEKLGATQTEVTVGIQNSALTRLANSIIDQNVAEHHATIQTIIYVGKKKGSTYVEVIDNDSIRKAVENAIKIAKMSPDDKDFQSLPGALPYNSIPIEDLVSKNTMNTTPEQRAEHAKMVIDTAHSVDDRIKAVAGAISHGIGERVILNSLGVEAYDARTYANVNLTILAEDGKEQTAGWYADNNTDFGKLHFKEVAEIAARKAAEGFGMKAIEPRDYEVVLEPAALSGLLVYIAYFGFSALMYQEYISFLRDKIGTKLFSEKFNLWDDALDERTTFRTFFDDEGFPKSKIDLVENGIIKNLAYDSYTAGRDNKLSTGHHNKEEGHSLPFPNNMFVGEGDSNLNEMISETKDGLLITHFHYQNAVNPTEGIFTALTRDGTWKIEKGEVKYPVRTLRFTDAAPRFLGRIDLLGTYPKINASTFKVPTIKLPSFRISSIQK